MRRNLMGRTMKRRLLMASNLICASVLAVSATYLVVNRPADGLDLQWNTEQSAEWPEPATEIPMPEGWEPATGDVAPVPVLPDGTLGTPEPTTPAPPVQEEAPPVYNA